MTTEVLRLGMDTKGFVVGAKNAQTSLGRLITGMTAAQKATIGLGVAVVALGLAYSSAIKGFIEFDSAMTQSLAIMGDVTEAMERDMVDAARAVAEELNFTAASVAEGFFFLASAGLDAEQSIAALPAVAQFARAGMFDLALATDLATDAQSALGLASNDAQVNLINMTRVTDVLVKANTLANATVLEFSEALTREAGAALKTFRIDVEEGVAVLAAFADQGVKGQLAGTSLSRVLRLMTTAAEDNAEAYEELNVAVFDTQGNIRNMADIVGDLERALLPLSDITRIAALNQLGFQARVQAVINPLLGTSEAIREYEAELRKAAGTTKEISDKQMLSLENRIGQIRQQFSNWRDEIVERTVPMLELLIDNADKAADALKALLLVVGTAGLVAAFIAIGPPVWAAVAAFVALVPAVTSVASALALLQLAMGPVGWMIAGLAAVTALVYKFIRAKRDEREAIEESRAASREALDERIAGLSRLTEAELKLRQVQLEASIALTNDALIKEGHIRQDDQRIVQLQEMEKTLAEVNRRLAESTVEIEKTITVSQVLDDALTPWQEFLEILKEIHEEAEAIKRANLKEAIQFGGGIIAPTRLDADIGIVNLGPMLTDLAEGQQAYAEAMRDTADEINPLLSSLPELAGGLSRVGGRIGEMLGILAGGFGIGAIAGVFASVISSITDTSDRDRIEREHNAILERNTQSIQEMTKALGGEGTTQVQLGQVGNIAQIMQNQMGSMGGLFTQLFADLIRDVGLPMADFDAIVKELGITLRDQAGRIIPEALEQLIAKTLLAVEALEKEQAAFDRNLQVRSLLARGLEEQAETLRQQIANEKELEEARRLGLDTTMLLAVQEEEQAARDQAKIDRAEEEKRIEDQRNDAMVLSIANRRTLLGLDDEEAAIFRFQIKQQEEMNAAIAAGFPPEIITALQEIQDSELAAFIQGFADAAVEAAESLAAAAAVVTASLIKDLDVRDLFLAGDVKAAKVLQFQNRQAEEFQRAVEQGVDQATLDRLSSTQAREFEQFVAGLTEAIRRADSDKRILTGAAETTTDTVAGFNRITQGQASLLIGLERTQVAILRDIERHLRPFGVTAPAFGEPITGGGGGGMVIEVNVVITGPVSAGDPAALGKEIGGEVLKAIDEGLGETQAVASAGTGAGLTAS